MEDLTIKIRRTIRVDREITGRFTVSRIPIIKTRKNQSEKYFHTCDYCTKKIDQDGEIEVILLEYADGVVLYYSFHEGCFEESTKN